MMSRHDRGIGSILDRGRVEGVLVLAPPTSYRLDVDCLTYESSNRRVGAVFAFCGRFDRYAA